MLEKPLVTLQCGQSGNITRIRGPRKLQRRLTELGLTEGAEIRLLNSTGKTFSVKVRDTRLALGFEVAAQVLVHHED